MHKSARLFILLSCALLLLPACRRTQAPTSLSSINGSSPYGDIVPDGSYEGQWGPELELRGANGGIQDGKYGDYQMVSGVLPSVYFGFDSTTISATERGKLQQAADYLGSNPKHKLLLEGHCDWYGTAEYNLALGDRRANSASSYLSTLGVDPMRVEVLSKGSLDAISGLSKAESAQDRRVDVIILK